MNDRLFQRVIEATARFDALDLLTAVAAWQMMRANISRTARLEVPAHAIATQAVDTDRAKPCLEGYSWWTSRYSLRNFGILGWRFGRWNRRTGIQDSETE